MPLERSGRAPQIVFKHLAASLLALLAIVELGNIQPLLPAVDGDPLVAVERRIVAVLRLESGLLCRVSGD